MPAKTKIIISDTHIGAGGAQYGNNLEDFISDQPFFDWLHRLIDESESDNLQMDLIINGDWIEFLQTPDVDAFDPARVYPTDAYTNVSVSAALRRLEVVHAGHPLVFQALADFVSSGPPRRTLTILFGNHDPELFYGPVQTRIRELLGACGYKKKLVNIGQRSYFEDGVYIEHGNAYTERFDQFTDSDAPVDSDDPDLIERPPGSYVVTDYYNQIEHERPWIDGVHPMTTLLFYTLAFDPGFALQALRAFLRVLPNLLSDIAAASDGRIENDDRLAALLQEEDDQVLANRLAEDETFAADFGAMMQETLANRGAAPATASDPPASPAPIASAPAASQSPLLRAREITEHYWHVLEEAAAVKSVSLDAKVVAFGHIHERIAKQLPTGATYLNTGAWVWKADFSESPEEVWRDLISHPEKYMNSRHLTYARVDINSSGEITNARLLSVNDPPSPPDPPDPQPRPGVWARFILALRSIIAIMSNWML